MPAHITSRTLANGDRRHDVRYRRGGRGYQLEHAGSFRTMREATIRRNLVSDWLAAGRNPKREIELLLKPRESVRLSTVAAQWLNTRVDLDPSTRDVYRGLQARIDKRFNGVTVSQIEPEDVNAWIQEMLAEGLKPGTVTNYVRLLRMTLDGLDENPARHKSVRLPRRQARVVEPPDADEVVALLAKMSGLYRPVVVLMEQTGMRVSEALRVGKDDIDRGGLRVRVRPETSKGDRPRWVPLEAWYADVIEPPRRMSRTAVGSTMSRASGINPHLLRHRRATLWHQKPVPVVTYASWLGHDPVLSLRTYSHVRPIEEIHPSRLLEILG